MIKYNHRGHLLNALAHASVEFREHCVAACRAGCLGTTSLSATSHGKM